MLLLLLFYVDVVVIVLVLSRGAEGKRGENKVIYTLLLYKF